MPPPHHRGIPPPLTTEPLGSPLQDLLPHLLTRSHVGGDDPADPMAVTPVGHTIPVVRFGVHRPVAEPEGPVLIQQHPALLTLLSLLPFPLPTSRPVLAPLFAPDSPPPPRRQIVTGVPIEVPAEPAELAAVGALHLDAHPPVLPIVGDSQPRGGPQLHLPPPPLHGQGGVLRRVGQGDGLAVQLVGGREHPLCPSGSHFIATRTLLMVYSLLYSQPTHLVAPTSPSLPTLTP